MSFNYKNTKKRNASIAHHICGMSKYKSIEFKLIQRYDLDIDRANFI